MTSPEFIVEVILLKKLLILMTLLLFVVSCEAPATPDDPKKDKPIIALLGNAQFASSDFQTIPYSFDEPLSNDIKFALLPDTYPLSVKEKSYLQTLLKEHVIILFYGEDVSPQYVQNSLSAPFTPEDVKTTIDSVNLIYGYGYSELEKRPLYYYLITSPNPSNPDDKIASFLMGEYNNSF